MAENRQACSNCSVQSFGGAYSVKVLIGDGNCNICRTNAPKRDSVDEPYRYRRPTSDDHTPFNDDQFARLLSFRGRMLERRLAKHTTDEDGL